MLVLLTCVNISTSQVHIWGGGGGLRAVWVVLRRIILSACYL